MIKKIVRRVVILLILTGLGAGAYYYWNNRPTGPLLLTGIVTEDGVTISSQVAGRIAELSAKEGDRVQQGQLLAVIEQKELQADEEYYAHSEEGLQSQVKESQSALRYQVVLTREQISQAEAALAVAKAQQGESAADLERTRLDAERYGKLVKEGVASAQIYDQARTAYDAAKLRAETLRKQVENQQAALALAHSNAEQIPVRESQVASSQHQVAAMGAQKQKAKVRVGYTEIRSPIAGIVNVRAAQSGEVVNPAQPILTLIDEDALWVRADVPESYVDQTRIGDKLTVRLPSGIERSGTVFFRGVDAGFATQRDVSRTKRDIKTFEIRLRVDNSDRALALGMSAYVVLPVSQNPSSTTK